MSIVLNSIPMPPTANHRLIPANGRLIKSNEARLYDKAVQVWMIRQKSALFEYRRKAKELIDHGYCLEVNFQFIWPKEKLITKDGMPKRIDTSNRLKDAEDAVSDILEIDDKFFIKKTLEKIPWPNSYEIFNATIKTATWSCEHGNY